MAAPAGTTPLAELIEAPAELARALAQIFLLPEGADGAGLQAGLSAGQALVSRDGALWRWDGHGVKAGAPSPGAVRLTQRNRLRAAEAALATAETEATEARAAVEAARRAEAETAAAEATARGARGAAETALSRARTRRSA
ncbi:hypothetical protein ACFQU7_01940 [Pseudoroseomonas wenyumeiae]